MIKFAVTEMLDYIILYLRQLPIFVKEEEIFGKIVEVAQLGSSVEKYQ